MDFFPLAFLMGLFGSLHCAVMCGPIMLGMPFRKQNFIQGAFQLLLYQLGRISVYTFLGLLAGTLGNSVRIFSDQKTLSIIIGSVLIVFTILQFSKRYKSRLSMLQLKAVNPLSKLMGKVFNLKLWGLFAGMLNGIIPCGMVYLALATALNTGSVKSGAAFMFLFGLGTTPLMLMISLGGIFLKRYISFNTSKLIPWMMLLMGTLLVMRSADLGIPFLSPKNTAAYGHAADCR
ncbi:sulfite exporter TauE/SafE family protein [Pedobacter miscanthi]|uniref:sulfite exporter TauE/SafE family protein n=1 Tax=Pedobacter miscanthi TaxID=2259170 RepID=UPI002931E9BD|nr:sulfite exporter TauE/SafE family protein [Pedobacter miscanthi]